MPSKATAKYISWASIDPEIATVSKTCKVTAIKKGTVTITAISQDGGKVKSTIKIKIN